MHDFHLHILVCTDQPLPHIQRWFHTTVTSTDYHHPDHPPVIPHGNRVEEGEYAAELEAVFDGVEWLGVVERLISAVCGDYEGRVGVGGLGGGVDGRGGGGEVYCGFFYVDPFYFALEELDVGVEEEGL